MVTLPVELACSSPGGCPWTQTSAVTVTPTTACLNVTVANATGSASPGGCVDPDLAIVNDCTDPLVLQAGSVVGGGDTGVVASDGGLISIPPSKSAVVEVSGHGAGSYVVNATLGATPIRIEFSASL